MNVIVLNNTTQQQRDEAAEANMVLHMSWVQQCLPNMAVEADEYLTVVDSGIREDTFNIVCRARLSEGMLEERIARAVTHFQSVQRPFTWWVGPADRPLHLGQVLEEAGLAKVETESAMMADLNALGEADLTPQGLRIECVRTPEQVRAFAALLAGPSEPAILDFYEAALPVLLRLDSPLWLYVGYLEDVPVATSEVTVGGGVAGLYNVSTLEPYRRRGIGSAMTLRPLLDAREQGYRTGVLQASAEGQGVYARLGFRVTGQFTEYKLPFVEID